MARYSAVPPAPSIGIEPARAQFYEALKQNVELLVGSRNEEDRASVALNKGSVTVATPPTPKMQRLAATGQGVILSGTAVPTLADYQQLVVDMQLLIDDVAALRATVDALITQLKG